jgi:hypothetical protein
MQVLKINYLQPTIKLLSKDVSMLDTPLNSHAAITPSLAGNRPATVLMLPGMDILRVICIFTFRIQTSFVNFTTCYMKST